MDILSADKRFNAFYDAIADSDDVVERLNSTSKSFTIFAPIDAAFDKLPSTTLEKLAEDKESMVNLLMKHIVLKTKVSQQLSHAGDANLINHLQILKVKVSKFHFATSLVYKSKSCL